MKFRIFGTLFVLIILIVIAIIISMAKNGSAVGDEYQNMEQEQLQ